MVVSKKVASVHDISPVNLIVEWCLFACSMTFSTTSLIECVKYADEEKYPNLRVVSEQVLVLVFGNVGKGAFIFREQGILSNYFQGTRELLGRLLWSRTHLSTLHSSVTILYALIRR